MMGTKPSRRESSTRRISKVYSTSGAQCQRPTGFGKVRGRSSRLYPANSLETTSSQRRRAKIDLAGVPSPRGDARSMREGAR